MLMSSRDCKKYQVKRNETKWICRFFLSCNWDNLMLGDASECQVKYAKKIIGTNSLGESLYELGPTKNKKQIGQQLIVLTCLINDSMIWCQMNI